MLRRSSSLVSTTTVIEIGESDSDNPKIINDQSSGSTEKIFEIVNVCSQDDLIIEEINYIQTGKCAKVKIWFQNCKNVIICSGGRNHISKFFTEKYKGLQEILQTRCSKSYLETYFLYASVCGVSPFHFGRENKKVVWLKKV